MNQVVVSFLDGVEEGVELLDRGGLLAPLNCSCIRLFDLYAWNLILMHDLRCRYDPLGRWFRALVDGVEPVKCLLDTVACLTFLFLTSLYLHRHSSLAIIDFLLPHSSRLVLPFSKSYLQP